MNERDLVPEEFRDASADGLVAVYAELRRDAHFAQLMGYLATVYGVTVRKVSSIDQRSFGAAKEALARFLARTTGWSAKLSRETRNGSWRRGAVYPQQQVQGRTDSGAVERVGRRSGGVRDGVQAPPLRQAPRTKDTCPSCGRPAMKVWTVRTTKHTGLVCPGCVRERTAGEVAK